MLNLFCSISIISAQRMFNCAIFYFLREASSLCRRDNILSNLSRSLLTGVQSPTWSIRELQQKAAGKNAALSPRRRPVPVEFKVRIWMIVCMCSVLQMFVWLDTSEHFPPCHARISWTCTPSDVSRALDDPSDSVRAEREREEWEREQQMGEDRAQSRSQRSVSRERWVETMVVADAKLIAYHGSDNVESYIFTIMNMVRG